jgi:hypothetical protein
MVEDTMSIKLGDVVAFLGFSDSPPKHGELLEEGAEYEIAGVNEATDETEGSYRLKVENPDYDPGRRKSKDNPEFIEIDVFGDEIELAETQPAKAKAKAKAEEEEEVTAPKKRGRPKKVKEETVEEVAPKKRGRPKKVKEEVAEEQEAAPKKRGRPKKLRDEQPATEHVDPDLRDMIILSPDEEDAEIVALINESDDICALAEEASEESAATDYRLGGILYHVRLSGAYKDLDEKYAAKGGFGVYVEERLSVGYRKSMYLIDIYAKWNKYGLPSEKVQEIGWTKAQEIARVMNADNAEELVELAEGNTVTDLKETIKESYVRKGEDTREVVKRVTFKFRLVENAAVAVREYFEMAKAHLGYDKDEDVFEAIVTEWAQEHLEVSKTRKVASDKRRSDIEDQDEDIRVEAAPKKGGRRTAHVSQ